MKYLPLILATGLTLMMSVSACDNAASTPAAPDTPAETPAETPAAEGNSETPVETPATETPGFATIQSIVENRCFRCHGNGNRSGGVNFDEAAEIVSHAERIKVRAVVQKTMPNQGNITGMTDEERATVGAWVDAGAAGP